MTILENEWNLWVWLECIGVVSGCCCKEVYNYIDILIIGERKRAHSCPLNLPNFRYNFINARRTRQSSSRLVCMYVCHAHAILAVRAI